MPFALIGMAFVLMVGQGPAADPPPQAKQKPAAKKTPFTPEREAAGLAFATANHPELADLLGSLRTMNRSQYETAVVLLSTQAENLSGLAKRDAEMHKLALQEWKAQSRLNVLAARALHLEPSARDASEVELRKLLEEQSDLRIARKLLEIKRSTEQLRKSEEQLQKLRSDRESWITQQLKRLLKTKDRPLQPKRLGTGDEG